MDARKTAFLDNLDAELASIDEVMEAPAAARKNRSRKAKQTFLAAAFAIAAPLLTAAPAAASTATEARTSAGIQGCADFTVPDYVSYSHTKYCTLFLFAGFSYRYSRTYNNGTVHCYGFLRTIYMPCSLPSQADVEACRAR